MRDRKTRIDDDQGGESEIFLCERHEQRFGPRTSSVVSRRVSSSFIGGMMIPLGLIVIGERVRGLLRGTPRHVSAYSQFKHTHLSKAASACVL